MIDQLLDFYFHHDKFQDEYLTEYRAREVYQYLLDKDRLHIFKDNSGELLGYGESWAINFEQFGRIICGQNLYKNIEEEDISTGNIAYLANVTIHPDWRGTHVLRMLRNSFFTKNFACDYFVGHAKRKKTQPIKVFTRSQAYQKWVHREVA